MALSRVKIGELITVVDKKNTEDYPYPFYGININKEFMPSVANTNNVDRKKYKVIVKNRFVFSGMQTGRDNCIRIGIYTEDSPVLVSPAYTTFEVTSSKILPLFFFMIFNSKEKDRYGAFLSDSSVRSNLDWDRFCDIELEVPSIDVQKKYVAIYKGLLANIRSYEKGLDDLKLVCDGYIEDLRREKLQNLKGLLFESFEKNEGLIAKEEKGVSIKKTFIDTKAKSGDLSKQKVVRPGYFAFNANTSRNSDTLSIALNDKNKAYAVSNTYIVFQCDQEKLLSKYLYLWFNRKEFDRFARFNSWGSAREMISLNDIEEYVIAIPSIEKQIAIIEILESIDARNVYLSRVKDMLANLCPILIRGSLSEINSEVG